MKTPSKPALICFLRRSCESFTNSGLFCVGLLTVIVMGLSYGVSWGLGAVWHALSEPAKAMVTQACVAANWACLAALICCIVLLAYRRLVTIWRECAGSS